MLGANECQFSGNIGRDPEYRETRNGIPYTTFTIAVDGSYRTKAGEEHDNTVWINCIVWGHLASLVVDEVRKGSFLAVRSRYEKTKWTDRTSGEERRGHQFKVMAVKFDAEGEWLTEGSAKEGGVKPSGAEEESMSPPTNTRPSENNLPF